VEEMEYASNGRASIELNWELLTAAERRVAMVLGVFPWIPIELEWVQDCVNEKESGWRRIKLVKWMTHLWKRPSESFIDPAEVTEILALLVKRNLVERKETGYQLNSLVREFLREKLAGTKDGVSENTNAVRLRCSNVMDRLVIHYEAEGKYLKAIPLCEQTLEIWQSELGDRHPDTATSLNNLAALYYSMGAYDRALPLYEQAIDILEDVLGLEHPNTKAGQENLRLLREKM
jgi:tetratricopeptide (TPR) repeat protein